MNILIRESLFSFDPLFDLLSCICLNLYYILDTHGMLRSCSDV
jgi:hypothetical protein